MRLLLTAILVASATIAAADPAPLRFAHTDTVQGVRLTVPMELYLSPAGETRIDAKLAGNLRDFQRNIPTILSDVVQDTCERRIGFAVDSGRAEGDQLRLNGRVQAILYACRDGDRATRRRLLSNITAVDVLLDAALRDDCLHAELVSLDLDPSGLAGFALNVTGLTKRIGTRVRDTFNETLRDTDTCLDLPDALKVLDATIDSGGFRDFGGGEMGFVIKAGITVNARNTIALFELLNAQDLLEPRPSCPCR